MSSRTKWAGEKQDTGEAAKSPMWGEASEPGCDREMMQWDETAAELKLIRRSGSSRETLKEQSCWKAPEETAKPLVCWEAELYSQLNYIRQKSRSQKMCYIVEANMQLNNAEGRFVCVCLYFCADLYLLHIGDQNMSFQVPTKNYKCQ